MTMTKGSPYAGQIHGRFPARLEEIRYERTADHPGWYKHRFTSPTDIYALTDGGLLIRPRNPGGPMGTPKLWLDNPRRGGRRRNPYLAAYNPGVMTLARSYASLPYLMAAASGAAGFGTTFLGYKALFSLTALSSYGLDPSYTGIAVRALGRTAVAALGDFALVRFFNGHNRMAYIGGAAAYVGLATLLEALGYHITVGAGQPLVSLLPASLQPAVSVAGAAGYLTPTHVAGAGAYVARGQLRGATLGAHPGRMYANRLSP